jgi:hypothetical protein
MKKKKKFAGKLGYFGMTVDPKYNAKVKQANNLVDEYNENFHKFKTSKEQMD